MMIKVELRCPAGFSTVMQAMLLWHAVYWDPSIAILSNKSKQAQTPARRPRQVYRLLAKEDITKELENEEVHANIER